MILPEWTDDEIVAQAVLFFLGGFESSSNLLCFAAHELAGNQDVQKKLQEEVDVVSAKCGGKINYEDLLAMKYMHMVISGKLTFGKLCIMEYKRKRMNQTIWPYQSTI